MKKIILVAALVLGFAVAAVAQPRAIGIRGGFGAGLSYQHTVAARLRPLPKPRSASMKFAPTVCW